MKLIIHLVLLAFLGLFHLSTQAASGLDILLHHESLNFETGELKVSVQVMVHERMILAGQNYRIYYPTSALSLNTLKSVSNLGNNYSDLTFPQIFENAQAIGVGKIPFEDDLGLVSMYIELENEEDGGIMLSPSNEWATLAYLSFDIIGDFEHLEMILARPDISKEYATAFTEFTSWTAPNKGRKIEIADYQDYYFTAQKKIELLEVTTSIGPNPTLDYVAVRLNQGITDEIAIEVYDISGRLMMEERLLAQDIYQILDVSHLQTATYFITLRAKDKKQLLAVEKLVVAR